MSEYEDTTLQTRSGQQIAARLWGESSAPPVLALHGWLDNLESFSGLAPHLVAWGYRLVALDLPGHGHSSWQPEGVQQHFIDWLPAVASALDALDWDELVLIGHSMGAGIATILAGSMPERVSRLVLLEGIGPATEPPEEAPRRVARALANQRKASVHKPRRVYGSVEEAVSHMLSARAPLEQESARRLAERSLEEVEGGVRFRYDPRLTCPSLLRLTEEHVLAFLSRIEAPTFVLRAEQGWPLPEEMVRARVEALSEPQIVRIPGGHHVHMDAPDRVASALRPFLELSE